MEDGKIESSFMKKIGKRLIAWGLFSILTGLILFYSDGDFLKSFGIQFIAWGLIDGIIGVPGILSQKPMIRKKLRKILLINGFLDIGYISVGLFIILLNIGALMNLGMGLGVIIQGGFLLIFDFYHAQKIKSS